MKKLISKYHYILLCFGLFGGDKSFAQNIVLTNIDKVQTISSNMLVFEDKSAKLNIYNIIEHKNLLKKQEKEIPSYSFSSSNIWCAFSILKKTDKNLFLEIGPPFLNKITLYSVFDDGRIDSTSNGSFYCKEMEGLGSTSYIFSLHPDAKLFYLKISTNTRLYITAKIGTEAAFFNHNSNFNVLIGVLGGIILMIFVYNLFLFATSHNHIYLYYLLHLINTFLNFLYLTGIGKEFMWGGQRWINEYFLSIMSLGFTLPLLFTIKYLRTSTYSKKIHYGMLLSIFALIIISALNIFGYHLAAGNLLNTVGFIIVVFVIYATSSIRRMGYKPASPFLYAWMFYFSGITIQVLQGLNVIPTTLFTSNAMQFGSIMEIITLSLAVAYQINYLKQEMRLSLVGERKALQEKEALIKEQNKHLENKAQRQSEEIRKKKIRLEQKNIEIIKQNEQIKTQSEKLHNANLLLEHKNRIIETQRNSLLFHKNNLETIIESRTSELKKATETATDADRLKTAFLKDISHEIRTPMNAIAGFASLLVDIDMNDKRHDYYIDIISKNTDELLNLIDNIIELSKIQTGSLKIKKVIFKPKKIFNALHEQFTEKLRDERKVFVSLKLSMPSRNDIKINTDYNKFWQIIFHLVDNALKYTEKGFIEFGFKFVANNNSALQVFVKDTGKGINQEKLKTIFDRFRKSEDGKTKLYSGTGLGLSLVKGLTEFMNGEIIVESKTKEEFPGQQPGTTVNIIFKNIINKN